MTLQCGRFYARFMNESTEAQGCEIALLGSTNISQCEIHLLRPDSWGRTKSSIPLCLMKAHTPFA